MMDENIRLVLESCRLYAETESRQAAAMILAAIVIAVGFILLCFGWTRLFNKSYRLSGLEWASVIITSVFSCMVLPLWLALNYMGDSARLEIRERLKDVSLDASAMTEIRVRVHDTLAQKNNPGDQDPAGLSPEARWSFSGRPDDASILSIAQAYSEALAVELEQGSALLSKFLSWDSAPSFIAADIRLHATQKPAEPYDLDPGHEALTEILTAELSSRIAGYVLVIRAAGIALMVLSMGGALAWLAFVSYRDIQVHWPSKE